ncbi:MAG TPA: hypothetical protein PKE16_05235 [Hyphomicrobium sp.]|nr:hypothetical protein [Hyphomicrobium sp.]
MMPATASAQNLIQDPSFEASSGFVVLPPWQVASGHIDTWPAGMSNITPNSGSFFANPFGSGGVLTQDVSLTKSGRYQFQFFYAVKSEQTWALTAKVQGITVFTKSDITNTTMQGATSVVNLNAGSAQVLFDAALFPAHLSANSASMTSA